MAQTIESILSEVIGAEVNVAKLQALRAPRDYWYEAGFPEYVEEVRKILTEDTQIETFLEKLRVFVTANTTPMHSYLYRYMIARLHPKFNELTLDIAKKRAELMRAEKELMKFREEHELTYRY
jgi:hypothetical protein